MRASTGAVAAAAVAGVHVRGAAERARGEVRDGLLRVRVRGVVGG